MPNLDYVTLPQGTVAYEAGGPIEYVYFPQTAVFSMVRHMADGAGIEVGTIGRDGVVGESVVLGARVTPTRCVVQIAGDARRIKLPAFLAALDRPSGARTNGATAGPALRDLCHRYAQALFEQAAQSAACNRLHALEDSTGPS